MTEAKEKDSIVIAGISGVGKTTLINSLKSHFEFTYLSYGEYVRKYGLEKAGQKFHEAYNDAPTSLVIMDEHLE